MTVRLDVSMFDDRLVQDLEPRKAELGQGITSPQPGSRMDNRVAEAVKGPKSNPRMARQPAHDAQEPQDAQNGVEATDEPDDTPSGPSDAIIDQYVEEQKAYQANVATMFPTKVSPEKLEQTVEQSMKRTADWNMADVNPDPSFWEGLARLSFQLTPQNGLVEVLKRVMPWSEQAGKTEKAEKVQEAVSLSEEARLQTVLTEAEMKRKAFEQQNMTPEQKAKADKALADRRMAAATKNLVTTALAPEATMHWLPNMLNEYNKAVMGSGIGAAKSVVIVGEALSGLQETSQGRLILQDLERIMNDALPSDPGRGQEFLTDLAKGGGSFTFFLISGAVGKSLGLSAKMASGVAGASVNMPEMLEDAERNGATTLQKYWALLAGMGLGASEALPIENMLFRAEIATGGLVTRTLRNAVHGSMEEFIQEFLQTLGEDAAADMFGQSWSPDRFGADSFIKAVRAGTIGGILGAGGGAATTLNAAAQDYAGTSPEAKARAEFEEERGRNALEVSQKLFDDITGSTGQETDLAQTIPDDPLMDDFQEEQVEKLVAPKIIESAIRSAANGGGALKMPPEITAPNLKAKQRWDAARAEGKKVAGSPKNNRTVITAPEGSGLPDIAVGEVTVEDWVQRNETLMTPEEIETASRWYGDIQNVFRSEIDDPALADLMMQAWLSAQQNASVSAAMNNTLLQAEQFARGMTEDAMKQAGLDNPTNAIRSILQGIPITQGVSRKIVDFVDSASGTETRSWMGDDPAGGSPFVVDTHTARDGGLVDEVFLNHLQRAGYEIPDGLAIDRASTGPKDARTGISTPTEAQYENIAQWGRNLTENLNAMGWQGRSDWKPHEVQAVGWMGMLKLFRTQGGDNIMDAFELNRRNISFEAVPGQNAPRAAKQKPRFDALPTGLQKRVSDTINERAWEIANEFAGVTIDQGLVERSGGYMGVINPSTVAQSPMTKETAEIAANTLGYILEQDEVWSHKRKPFTKNPKAIALDIYDNTGALSDIEFNEIFMLVSGLGPKDVDGNPVIQGFQPVRRRGGAGNAGEVDGIRILVEGKPRELAALNDFIDNGLLDAIQADVDIDAAEAEIYRAKNDWAKDRDGNGYLEKIDSLRPEGRGILGDAKAELDTLIEQSLTDAEQDAGIESVVGRSGNAERSGPGPAPRQDGKVELTHWSDLELNVIDPNAATINAKKGYTPQMEWSDDPNYVPRTYFGVNAGSFASAPLTAINSRNEIFQKGDRRKAQELGYWKEGGLGNLRHTVSVDPGDLYNWNEDPLGLAAKTTKEGKAAVYEMERLVRDAGFKGIYYPRSPLGEAAIAFSPMRVESVYEEPAKRTATQEPPDGVWRRPPPSGVPLPRNVKAPVPEGYVEPVEPEIDALIPQRPDAQAALDNWLGDSELSVAGNPQVFYHRTSNDFTEFRVDDDGPSGPVLYFGDNPDQLAQMHNRKAEGDQIMPVYLKGETPLMLDEFNLKEMQERWAGGSKEFPFYITPEQKAALEMAGFDSILAEDVYGKGDGNEVVVFDSTQIKSASGNQGTFDPNNPDIDKAQQISGNLPGTPQRPAKGMDAQPDLDVDGELNAQRVVQNLKRVMDLSISQGLRRRNMGDALALYDRRQGVIRARDTRNVGAIMHEAGHALNDDAMGDLKDFIDTHGQALRELGFKTYGKDLRADKPETQIREGFAEFFRLYMVNPDYMVKKLQLDRQVVTDFEAALSKKDPRFLDAIKTVSEQYRTWITLPSTDFVKSQITSMRRLTPFEEAQQSLRELGVSATVDAYSNAMGERVAKIYTEALNKTNPMQRLVSKLVNLSSENNKGEVFDLKRAEDPGVILRMLHNVQSRSLTQLKDGIIDYRSMDQISLGMVDIIQTLHGKTPGEGTFGQERMAFDPALMADFEAYLVAKRGVYEFSRFTIDEIRNPPLGEDVKEGDLTKAVRELEAKHGANLVMAAKMVWQFNQALLHQAVSWQHDRQGDVREPEPEAVLRTLDARRADMKNLLPNQVTRASSPWSSGSGIQPQIYNPLESMMMQVFAVDMAIETERHLP